MAFVDGGEKSPSFLYFGNIIKERRNDFMDIKKELESKRNLFITGPAGTGKSYLLNEYIKTHENVIVCAPTGLAAVNIGGETMHKVFHIPIPAFGSPSFAKGKKGTITQGMLKPIAKADTIIIDEISMARNDVFSYAIKVIRKAEKLKGEKIKLIVCGDFSQLPPVVKKNELPLMKKFGLDPSGYAFTTQEWKSCNFKVIELTEVKRQEDQEFINEINRIRIGDTSNLDYFKRFVNPDPDYSDAICICGTNAEADRMNTEYLDSLPGNPVALQSGKEGRAAGYVDDIIVIKEGANIIFTINDYSGGYKNGMFGVVKEIHPDHVVVSLNGEDVEVYKHKYSVYSYSVTGSQLSKKEIGVVSQYPFKLGKAITIHKSQGQTFDKVIISPDIFAAGQLYVVLSRVRSPEGMVLLRELASEDLIIDEKVKKFYKNGYTWEVKKKAGKKKEKDETAADETKKTKAAATKKKPATAKSKSTASSKKPAEKGIKKKSAKTTKSKTGTKTAVKPSAAKKTARKESGKAAAKTKAANKATRKKKSAKTTAVSRKKSK